MKLLYPVASMTIRNAVAASAPMLMPETPMYEDDLPQTNEDHIWISRKVLSMQSKTVPERMGQSAHDQLRRGVFRTHPCHDEPAFFWSHRIHDPNPALISELREALS